MVQTSGATILVVDDDERILTLIKGMLYGTPFRVLTAINGEDAIQVAQQAPEVNLLLTDFNMPRLNGLDTAKQILAMRPGLPVVIMSVHSGLFKPFEKEWRFLEKPFSPATLVNILIECLKTARSEQPNQPSQAA